MAHGSNAVKRFMRHFLETSFEGKKFQTIEVDLKANTNRTTWCISDPITIYLSTYQASNVITVAKIFCTTVYLSNEEVLHELFSRELKTQKFVDEIEKLLNTKIRPTLYSYSKKYRIILEKDLIREGYLAKSPEKGLNLEESKRAIILMAQFHAGSVALYEKKPDITTAFEVRIILQECKYLTAMYSESMEKAISLMQKTYPVIATEMRKCRHITMEQIIDLFDYDSREFCVLNHGDFCINNLLFANDGAAPMLLNYQMAIYSSPAIDLLHFLNTSGDIAVMYDQDEQLLELYLRTLRDTMQLLNCGTIPPTMEELKAAMRERILYAVFAGITFKLNTMIAGEDEESNRHYEEVARKMLLIMYHKNYFDYRKEQRFLLSEQLVNLQKNLLKNEA